MITYFKILESHRNSLGVKVLALHTASPQLEPTAPRVHKIIPGVIPKYYPGINTEYCHIWPPYMERNKRKLSKRK